MEMLSLHLERIIAKAAVKGDETLTKRTCRDKLKAALGSSNVHIIDTEDHFCLNAVVQGDELLTNKVSECVKGQLEEITGLKVVQNDTSVFQKSGGSVRCMILDL